MEQKVISVCKKSRRSVWAGTQAKRHNDAGMKMVVVHSVGQNGKKTSKTMYVM